MMNAMTGVDLIGLEDNLMAWVGRDALVAFVLDAVSAEDRPPSPHGESPGRRQQEMMLTLLVYCYATGRHASEEVTLAATDDPTARYLALQADVTPDAVRRFRRENRGLLRRALCRVIESSWQYLLWVGHQPDRPEDWRPILLGLDPGGTDPAAFPFRQRADRWIDRAILIDGGVDSF
jgi:hypothetical protein